MSEAVVAQLRAAGCVWAEDEAGLLVDAAGSPAELDRLVARRVSGEPIELVLGWVQFLGRRLAVAPGVFVPRRRTELLARTTIARLAALGVVGRRAPVVVEMCAGVGPVAACLEGSGADVVASDLSAAALECARRNAPTATLHVGDLFDALPRDLRRRIDVLVANAPYVPTDRIAAMPPEARDHEPHAALDGGIDGVEVHRRLTAGAGEWLAPGGILLIETSPSQVDLTVGAMTAAGLVSEVVIDAQVGGCVAVGSVPISPGPARG